MNITFMTFNLRTSTANDGDHNWIYRCDKAARMIREHSPAVIGTQETRLHMLEELQLAEYRWVGEGRRGGSEDEHCAIFYKQEELELLEHSTFWLSEQPEQAASKSWDSSLPRICTWANFKHKGNGAEFIVFNTHLDHKGQLARENGIKLIWSRMQEIRKQKGLPVALMGDFNAYPDETTVRIMRGEVSIEDTFVDMKDVYSVMEGPIGSSANGQYLEITEGEPIDYIFVSPEVSVQSVQIDRRRIDGLYPSDHYPVVARLQLN